MTHNGDNVPDFITEKRSDGFVVWPGEAAGPTDLFVHVLVSDYTNGNTGFQVRDVQRCDRIDSTKAAIPVGGPVRIEIFTGRLLPEQRSAVALRVAALAFELSAETQLAQ